MQTPWGDFAVADAHVHFFSRSFYASLGAPKAMNAAQVAAALGWQEPPDDPTALARAWVEELDQNGVAQAAIIASVPGDEDSVKQAARAFPERFWPYAMVNPLAERPPDLEGLSAICLFPAMHGYSLHDERVQALLERAAGLRCAVFVHCGVLTVGARRKLGLPSPFDMRYSNPLDLHAVALRFPQVPFLIPHFGAGYFREALMLADLCPNVYLDTSSTNSWMRYEGLDLKTVFRRALAVAGAGRLLFGTDSSFFPRGWNQEIFESQMQALFELGVSAEDAQQIFGGNLTRIFC
jgi:predicted TIM-barrel fold metal-dependent hydrolase